MEKLFLEEPSINRKKDAMDYLEENVKYNSDFNGTGSLELCLEGITYEEWLIELISKKNSEYVEAMNICLSKTFFVVRESEEKIVGMVNIRYNISKEKLSTWASHIGYGIRPTERGKGYAKIALYLALIEEQKLGEEKVLLICDVNNVGSSKVIEALGGVLVKTQLYPIDNEMTNYYYINVSESIDRYYSKYSGRIRFE